MGTPDFSAISLAFNLSPMTFITWGDGPIQINLLLLTFLAKAAFSDKKPYPGWIASAPDC